MGNCVLPPHNAAFLPVKMRSLLIIAADAWGENPQWEELVKAQPGVAQVCRHVYVTSFSKNAFPPRHKNCFSNHAQSWLQGKATVDSRDKMNVPSYFAAFLCVSISLPSPCAVRCITSCRCGGLCRGYRFLFGMWDIRGVSSGFNTDNWLTHCVKLIGSLTENYYCVSYFRSELCFLPHHNCWNTGKMTLRAGLCFPTLGVLQLHPGMLQRTKDDPLLLICSISVVFQPFYMKQPNETFHFSFLRHSWCKFVESRWHLQEALSPAFKSWQPLKDAFTKPSVSPEHCGNVAYFSQFPTLSDTRTPSFNTC